MGPEVTHDAKSIAARHWFGYGRWSAPYWFVGMEPGSDDDPASYESWLALAGPLREGLIDCKEHHDDSNRRTTRVITHFHDARNARNPVARKCPKSGPDDGMSGRLTLSHPGTKAGVPT
jgi:hypothetical protein